MKICQVMFAKNFGGAERYYVDLTKKLAERGHDVVAVSHTGSVAEGLLKGIPGVKHYSVSVLGNWDPFIRKKILKIVSAHQPDVVQAHLARGAYLVGKVTSRLNIPLLAHTHNLVNLKYYKNVDKFIPSTNTQYNYLIEHGVAPDKIQLIRNFSTFTPIEKIQCGEKVRKIVSHGRFVHKKGFDLLLKVLADIPDRELELYIAGDGPEREAMTKLVLQYKLQDRVHFAGWQEDIRSFLLQGDLFVLPSRDEPFGIAILEAMACGLPVVTTKCQGPVEVLDDSTAYFCEPDDADSLAGAIKMAIQDPQGRQSRAQAAWEDFQDRYSLEKIIPQFESLYQQAVSQ